MACREIGERERENERKREREREREGERKREILKLISEGVKIVRVSLCVFYAHCVRCPSVISLLREQTRTHNAQERRAPRSHNAQKRRIDNAHARGGKRGSKGERRR